MKLVFDTYGNDKQKQVAKFWIDATTTDIVYGGSKGSGKSYLGVSLIFGDAFLYPGTHYFIARKTLANIRKFTIPSILEVFGHWGVTEAMYRYNGQDNYYELNNGSRVYLLDAKFLPSDPQYYRFGSMQMTRGWIEEAGEFEEEAKNNLSASIGRWKNDKYNLAPKLLQTCNPSKNYLYYNYYQPNKQGVLDHWKKFIQALPQDNKRLPDGYLENLHRTLSKNEKERLLYGNWEFEDSPDILIQYEKIIALWTNDHIPGGDKYISCDVARYGRDKTVIAVWDGWRIIKLITMAKSSTDEVAAKIKGLRLEYQIPAENCVIDEDGVGGGVVDQVKGARGFVNNSSAVKVFINGKQQPENYANLKSQCYYKFAEKVMSNEVFIACSIDPSEKEAIVQELEQVKQKNMDKETKKAVLSKDEVKAIIGRSPDYSDCFMMRNLFDLKQKRRFAVA